MGRNASSEKLDKRTWKTKGFQGKELRDYNFGVEKWETGDCASEKRT